MMASYWFKVIAVLVVTSEGSLGTRDADRRFRFPEYPLHDSLGDTETVDGSYITHMDSRLKTMPDSQPERTPVFQPDVEEPTHRPDGVGHRLLGDQQSLQQLSDGNHTDEKLEPPNIEKPSQQEVPLAKDIVLPPVSGPTNQFKPETKKATMLPILLKPYYTILQKQEATIDIPQLPVIVNRDAVRFSPQTDDLLKPPQNDRTTPTKPNVNVQTNCEEMNPNTRVLTQGEGKSYDLAPSALPLVGGLPQDSARLQILSENPHHIFIHPPKVFPVTPSPELSGPLLGGPPIKPTTTTQTRLSQIYHGLRRPNTGRTLFFESKPHQNLQTLQQQMYPIRTRIEALPDMQPVQYYLQPSSRLNMQYPIGSLPIASQNNQEQMLLMVQRRYVRNYNNRDLLPYMQPVAVFMMPADSAYPQTEQN